MSSRKNGRRDITDKNTDMMFGNYVNDLKLNEQLRAEFENPSEMKRLKGKANPKLSTRITDSEYKNTLGKARSDKKHSSSESESSDLPSNTHFSSHKKNDNVEFDSSASGSGSASGSDDDDSSGSASDSVKSPLKAKLEPRGKSDQNKAGLNPKSPFKAFQPSGSNPNPNHTQSHSSSSTSTSTDKVPETKKRHETPEERRIRSRTAYSTLQDIREKGVQLNKHYNPDDDPDEMEAEITLQRERRNKKNQVKFYKNTLLTIVCGVEFLNEKYDPFAFKLRDWSKHVASEQDEYVEILEELYEKYKDRGGKMAPEVRLLLMMVMSAVTFHLSQTLFGPAGMKEAMKTNPNVVAQMLKTLTGGAGSKQNPEIHEPQEARSSKPDNKHIMNMINQRRGNGATSTASESNHPKRSLPADMDDADASETDTNGSKHEIEREKRVLAEERARFEKQTKRQEEAFRVRMEQQRQHEEQLIKQNQHMQNRLSQMQRDQQKQTIRITNPLPTDHSDNDFSDQNIFVDATDIRSPVRSDSKRRPSAKLATPTKINTPAKSVGFDNLLESLEESSELDISDIMVSVNKRNQAKKKDSIRNASKRKSDSASEGMSTVTRRKATVIKL